MTCSAVVLICPVKDEAGRQFLCLEFPPVPLSQAPLFCCRAQDFMRRGSPVSWEPSLPLINSSRLLPPFHAGGGRDVLPNRVPSYLFNGLTAWPSRWLHFNSFLKRWPICVLIKSWEYNLKTFLSIFPLCLQLPGERWCSTQVQGYQHHLCVHWRRTVFFSVIRSLHFRLS